MSTGFTFGAKTTATPTFGTGNLTFGTPTAQSTFGTTPSLFGTPQPTATAAPTLSFGATPATSASTFGFGAAPATSAPTFGFGAAPATSGPSFSFGATPATTAPTFGFGGTPATSATAFNFGGTPATAAPTLGFGATPVSAAAPAFGATSFSLGATTNPSLNLLFKPTATTAPTLGLSFGTTTTTTPSLFGTTTATTTGFTLGAPATGGFSFGATTATTTTPITTATSSVGLGGIALAHSKATSASEEVAVKDQALPNEFLQSIEQFKTVVQKHKSYSTEVSHCSIKDVRKVESDLESLINSLNQIEVQLNNNRDLTEQLKYDMVKGLQNIEMAQRTQNTPAGLQHENTAPLQFFIELSQQCEKGVQDLKYRIDVVQKLVKHYEDISVLAPEDLTAGLKRINEIFVTLAARIQLIHGQVEEQKEIYRAFRRQLLSDNSDPFKGLYQSNLNYSPSKLYMGRIESGPTPFNNITLNTNNLTMGGQQTPPPPTYPTTTASSGLGLSFGQSGNTTFFKPTLGQQPYQFNTSTNFQLQKPPFGNKRGKQ